MMVPVVCAATDKNLLNSGVFKHAHFVVEDFLVVEFVFVFLGLFLMQSIG